ncbi:hypothetical protein AAEX28_13035 [Lentisphaerota bacterium WC36G]|nr:hypothetical protein LJT99_15860 [Lentisphaerae bacterium WC36]
MYLNENDSLKNNIKRNFLNYKLIFIASRVLLVIPLLLTLIPSLVVSMIICFLFIGNSQIFNWSIIGYAILSLIFFILRLKNNFPIICFKKYTISSGFQGGYIDRYGISSKDETVNIIIPVSDNGRFCNVTLNEFSRSTITNLLKKIFTAVGDFCGDLLCIITQIFQIIFASSDYQKIITILAIEKDRCFSGNEISLATKITDIRCKKILVNMQICDWLIYTSKGYKLSSVMFSEFNSLHIEESKFEPFHKEEIVDTVSYEELSKQQNALNSDNAKDLTKRFFDSKNNLD